MSQHVIPPRTYLLVFAALIALTCLTVYASTVPLGTWHTLVGLGFGLCKAALVMLFFMHLLYSSRLTWVVAVAGVFWLAILIFYTVQDYATRHLLSY